MGRSASNAVAGSAGIITTSSDMPISGKFGTGRVAVISSTQAFLIPATSIRVRLWGAGANSGGGGGGFAMKVLSGLTIGQSVTATVGVGAATGGTTSFGAYLSATGGKQVNGVAGDGGVGVGGDVNTTGGSSGAGSTGQLGGGGAANLLGRGGNGGAANQAGGSASSGGGSGGTSSYAGTIGGFGMAPFGEFGIDLIGCGSGTSGPSGNGLSEAPSPPNSGNGGGGGAGKPGGFPGGGGGSGGVGADGLIIVEY